MAKYLVLVDFNRGQAARQDVVNRGNSSKDWVQQHQSSGAIESAYVFSAGGPRQGGCAIVQANSDAELQTLLNSNPASPHVRYETHQLLDYGTGIDQLNTML